MSEPYTQISKNIAQHEIDLGELFRAIWAGRLIIFATTIFFSILSVFYALSLPNIYRSDVILAPATESAGIKIPGQIGGLAALAGVNLGSEGGDKTTLALEVMKSREFLGRFIIENDLLIPIMAAKGWDRKSDKLIIDHDIYDEETGKWVRVVDEPFKPEPTVLETLEVFDKLFSVSQNKESGIITLTMEHFSPVIAKDIADKLVRAINENMRMRELNQAEKSISYLNKKIAETNLSDVKTMLFSLIEEQTKILMLANVREEYIFNTVDRAVIAEKKTKPARALICIFAMISGFMLGIIISSMRYLRR